MDRDTDSDRRITRRRLLSMVGGAGVTVPALAGRGQARPGNGPPGGPPGDDGGSKGVGPCTCGSCPSGTFCGKVEGAPEPHRTYEFSSGGDSYVVTITSVERKSNGEITGFTFRTPDAIEKVCVKGGPETETYTSFDGVLRPPRNPGGNRPEISNFSFCGTDAVHYYQADIVVGDPITDLMPSNRYGDRLLAALVVSETGTYTGELIAQPAGSGTRTVDGGTCTFAWENFAFDATTNTTSATVSVTDTDGTSSCPVSLAMYRLPAGKTEVTGGMIGDQTFLGAQSAQLSTGDSTLLDVTV